MSLLNPPLTGLLTWAYYCRLVVSQTLRVATKHMTFLSHPLHTEKNHLNQEKKIWFLGEEFKVEKGRGKWYVDRDPSWMVSTVNELQHNFNCTTFLPALEIGKKDDSVKIKHSIEIGRIFDAIPPSVFLWHLLLVWCASQFDHKPKQRCHCTLISRSSGSSRADPELIIGFCNHLVTEPWPQTSPQSALHLFFVITGNE